MVARTHRPARLHRFEDAAVSLLLLLVVARASNKRNLAQHTASYCPHHRLVIPQLCTSTILYAHQVSIIRVCSFFCTTEAPNLIAHLADKGLDEAHPGVPDRLVGAGIGAALHCSVGAGDRAIGVPRVCMHTTTNVSSCHANLSASVLAGREQHTIFHKSPTMCFAVYKALQEESIQRQETSGHLHSCSQLRRAPEGER